MSMKIHINCVKIKSLVWIQLVIH